MKTFKEFSEATTKFKLGDRAKVNKPDHPYHGKVITIIKGRTGDRTKRGIYAGGLDNSLEASSFHKDELEHVKKD